MTRYRLAIFDFDGTLANSLPWFRASFQDMISAVRSCARPRRGGGRVARNVGARNHGAAQRIHVATAGHRQRHAKAQARRGKRDIAIRGHPGDAFRPATPRHQDRHRQFRQRSLRPAGARTRHQPDHPLRLRRRDVRQALEISARRTKAWRTKPSETICIGDEIRDIEAAKAAGMDSGAVAWGYALPAALQAAGPTHLFNSIEEMMQRLTMTK